MVGRLLMWLLGSAPKKDGTARPIAVGEVLRRLASKVLCNSFRQEASDYFWPLQLGVSCRLGAEVGYHTLRQWAARNRDNPEKVVVKINFENAFNSIDRATMLREVRHHFPGLAAWADFCYSSPSNLVFGSAIIKSEVGVHQGDPLGPLLFSTVLQPVLQRLASAQRPEKLDVVFAYLDDLCLAGSALPVAAAVQKVQECCPQVGLKLSTGDNCKCQVIPTAGHNSQVNLAVYPADFKKVSDANFEVLGLPIGSDSLRQAHTQVPRCSPPAPSHRGTA